MITAAEIVDRCRTLAKQGKYNGAVNILREVDGLSSAQYDDILSGKMTISSDWRLVHDNAEAEIAAAFRDVFRAEGRFFRPVLVVYPRKLKMNDFETEGSIFAVVRTSGTGTVRVTDELLPKIRSVTVASSYAMEDDMLLVCDGDRIFLCEESMKPPPFLMGMVNGQTPSGILSNTIDRLPAQGEPEIDPDDQIRGEVRARVGPEDGPGWISLRGKNALWRVPALPFHAWGTIQDSRYKALASGSMSMPAPIKTPDWEPVSPSGLRLSCDIPEHSDWLLGSRRLDLKTGQWRDGALDDYRDDDLLRAAVQRQEAARCGEVGYVVLAGGRAVTGTTLVDPPEDLEVCPPGTILVLETAGASWLQLASTASAVIVEVGGALAHLIVELRDASIPVLRVPGARAKFPTGTALSVDPATGLVQEV